MEKLKDVIISLAEDYNALIQPSTKHRNDKNNNEESFESAWESCLSTHPSDLPLLMGTGHNDWREIEIQNIIELLENDHPKKFFVLSIDFHNIKSSLKNKGIICVPSEIYKDIVCHQENNAEKYILFQESTSCWHDDTLIGIAHVVHEMKSSNSFDESDKEIQVIYLSLSRSNQTLCDVKLDEINKIDGMLRLHVDNLRKRIVLPYVAEIYVRVYSDYKKGDTKSFKIVKVLI